MKYYKIPTLKNILLISAASLVLAIGIFVMVLAEFPTLIAGVITALTFLLIVGILGGVGIKDIMHRHRTSENIVKEVHRVCIVNESSNPLAALLARSISEQDVRGVWDKLRAAVELRGIDRNKISMKSISPYTMMYIKDEVFMRVAGKKIEVKGFARGRYCEIMMIDHKTTLSLFKHELAHVFLFPVKGIDHHEVIREAKL